VHGGTILSETIVAPVIVPGITHGLIFVITPR
jgi:hypothetical protein